MQIILGTIDYSQLTPLERVMLAQELWDSVRNDMDSAHFTPALKMLAARRAAEIDSGAVTGIAWEEAKRALLGNE